MFTNATKRSNTDYVMWKDPTEEHPTQYYSNLPIWRYPSKYKVNSVNSADLCGKAFLSHSAFSAGIYSLGTRFVQFGRHITYIFTGCACDKT